MAKLRIFKLGDLEHKILPSVQMVQRLAEMLCEWDGKSPLDIVWGPDIKVIEIDVSPDDIHLVTDSMQEVKDVKEKTLSEFNLELGSVNDYPK